MTCKVLYPVGVYILCLTKENVQCKYTVLGFLGVPSEMLILSLLGRGPRGWVLAVEATKLVS